MEPIEKAVLSGAIFAGIRELVGHTVATTIVPVGCSAYACAAIVAITAMALLHARENLNQNTKITASVMIYTACSFAANITAIGLFGLKPVAQAGVGLYGFTLASMFTLWWVSQSIKGARLENKTLLAGF